jgi:hypothetical protein
MRMEKATVLGSYSRCRMELHRVDVGNDRGVDQYEPPARRWGE